MVFGQYSNLLTLYSRIVVYLWKYCICYPTPWRKRFKLGEGKRPELKTNIRETIRQKEVKMSYLIEHLVVFYVIYMVQGIGNRNYDQKLLFAQNFHRFGTAKFTIGTNETPKPQVIKFDVCHFINLGDLSNPRHANEEKCMCVNADGSLWGNVWWTTDGLQE